MSRSIILSASHWTFVRSSSWPATGRFPGPTSLISRLSFGGSHGHETLDGTEMHGDVNVYQPEETLANNAYYSKCQTPSA